ncbi:MAG TPA: sulfotransferase domain-containing protein [Thermodesulfobacteriota bacterium]
MISFPKSGRTWLRILIGKTLCERFNLPEEIMLDTYKVTAAAGILRTLMTHDDSSIIGGYKYYKYNELSTNKKKFRKKKVIFLVRNLKDILVSFYFQVTKREGYYTGNISDFIHSDRYGIKKILTFYNIWHENTTVPKEFLLLKYEDIHNNAGEVLSKTMKFLGCDVIDNDIIKKAVEFARFNNMKKMEKDGFFKNESMRPANINDEESYKIRRGIVGGYENYLSERDIKYIDQTIKEMGNPFESI